MTDSLAVQPFFELKFERCTNIDFYLRHLTLYVFVIVKLYNLTRVNVQYGLKFRLKDLIAIKVFLDRLNIFM